MEETTNPVIEEVETDDRSIEDRLAASFEKAEKAGKEPAEEAPAEESETDEVEASAETEDTPADDTEETEYEGKVYKLPKELKEALLRQKDYTQKTQDVAEQKRYVEQQKAQLETRAKFQAEHFQKASELEYLNRQLQQFGQVNWAELADSNPAQYLQLDRQQRTLQDAANRLQTEIQHLAGQFEQQMTQARQKAQAQCAEELKRTFGTKFGPDLLKGLDETGRSYGFSGEELAQVADPRMIRVLHDAMQYRKLQSSKSLVEKKVSTAKPVQLATSRSATTQTANAALAEAKARAMKTGKTSDVEDFLAKRFAKSTR